MAQAHGCIRGGKLQCQEETRDPGEASPQDPTRATGGSSFGGGSVIGDRLSSPSQADILLEHTVMDVRLSAVDASDAFCFGCAIETSLWMWRPPPTSHEAVTSCWNRLSRWDSDGHGAVSALGTLLELAQIPGS